MSRAEITKNTKGIFNSAHVSILKNKRIRKLMRKKFSSDDSNICSKMLTFVY